MKGSRLTGVLQAYVLKSLLNGVTGTCAVALHHPKLKSESVVLNFSSGPINRVTNMIDRHQDFTGAGGSFDADARRGYRYLYDFDYRHLVLAAHTCIPMLRSSRAVHDPFEKHAYARQRAGMQSVKSPKTGLDSVAPSGNYPETLVDHARSYGHG